jgi:LAS seventeen-binding protein 5
VSLQYNRYRPRTLSSTRSKYGNVHRQIRALTILDGLIENAGPRFQRVFADEPLLERLRVIATDSLSDEDVKMKCQLLFRQWAVDYRSTPGMERIVILQKQLPRRKKPVRQEQSEVLKETEQEVQADPFGENASASGGTNLTKTLGSLPSKESSSNFGQTSSKGSKTKSKNTKQPKSKPLDPEKEKPRLLETIASSSVASINLMNALKLINREKKRVSEDPSTVKHFELCKLLRRQILHYIQHVDSEQWLGSLIHANEELVTALMAYEVLDKSLEDDSDSEDEEWVAEKSSKSGSARQKPAETAFAGLHLDDIPKITINKKDKRVIENESDEDSEPENSENPFADSNEVHTPNLEGSEIVW